LHVTECFRLLRRGLPYFWATASNLLTLQLDKIIVVSLMSAEAAGIYAVAVTFSSAQSFLGEALGITSFALLSNAKSIDRQGEILTETFRQATLTSAALGLLQPDLAAGEQAAATRKRAGSDRSHEILQRSVGNNVC